MAATLVNRVKINITSTGTGALTLGAALAKYRGQEVLINGNIYSYVIEQNSAWEFGRGTYLAASNQLTRSVLGSSDGGTPIKLTSGAWVTFTALAEDLNAVSLTADVNAAAVAVLAAQADVTAQASSVAANAAFIAGVSANIVAGQSVYSNAYAATLPKGVTSGTIGGTAITGATPGTYPLTPTGGSIAGVQANLVVLTATTARIDIVNTGLGSGTTPPTWAKPAGATLPAGTTLTAVVSTIIPDQKLYWAISADGNTLLLCGNNAGSFATAPFGGTQLSAPTSSGLTGIATALTAYTPITATIDPGYFYHRTTGVRTAAASYQNIVYNIAGGEKGFMASGTLGGGVTAALAVYFSGANATGTVLGFQIPADSSDHPAEVLTIPTGTASIAISAIASGIPMVLRKGVYIDGAGLDASNKASVRVQTRSALQALDTVSADFGNAAQVFGVAVSGDTPPHRYVRGGGCYPTTNGWGIDPAETNLTAQMFGITSPRDDTVDSSNALDIYRKPSASQAKEDTTDTYVAMPTSGLFTPKGIDWNKLHFADLTAGQTLEVDISKLPYAKIYRFAVRNEAHNGVMVLDAGYAATFIDTGTRYLSCTPGTSIAIQRLTGGLTAIVSLGQIGPNAAPTGIAQGSYTPIVRATSAFFAGQSLTQAGYGYGASHGAFVNQLAALTGPASVHMVNVSYGGSGVCERDCDPGTPTNYWVNMTNPASPSDGPLITTALAMLASKNGDSSQPAYAFFLLDLGQQSSGYVDSPASPNANFTKAMYKTAMQYIITRLRTGGGSSTLKGAIRPIGRRSVWTTGNAGRMQVIRDAQLEIVAADANLFLGAETYDVELRDIVHPTDTGYDIIGARDADEVAKVVYAKTGMVSHPTIISATLNTTLNCIDVVIQTGNYSGGNTDRVFLVPSPAGFYPVNSSGVAVPVVRAYWTTTDISNPSYQRVGLRLFLSGPATGGTLYYVWDNFPGFDPQRPIRTNQTTFGKALRSAKVAL